ncbi:monofunctional biosynthetic peptidoglycan transglycosylase [Qingshengfaniella alkalisoli]|uniref:Biosynthetic peptidoglycan transglycosylase n=1 Tax=Qingshengfaniella alkalisoli TaxID=2599296 RepID=A0A5B8J6I3_9RHOB|nr:monofunctional biosynthetic peptidoglycan transglycosylase [Qingshengfaniella alkalisoli]QDY69950.1 monofunctional biosynthetic peptidoglycan transglycosylase [Qingshengfaniella alkalisoli]
MAKTKRAGRRKSAKRADPGKVIRRWVLRGAFAVVVLFAGLILLFSIVPVPTTPYMLAESRRLGGVDHEWRSMDRIAPVMVRSAVAAEDANYCAHWGFDIGALRKAIEGGVRRGGSTISQQTVKNVFLWQGRSWPRKALEAVLTPAVELVWTKRRILEVYLNVAEFGEGVFGVQAAARHYFETDAQHLTPVQAARLAAILPDPKDRSASSPGDFTRRRAASIMDGAATINRDGRARCFSG